MNPKRLCVGTVEDLFVDTDEFSSTSGSSFNLDDGNDDWIMAAVQSAEMSLTSSSSSSLDHSSQFNDEDDEILMKAAHEADIQLFRIKSNERSRKRKFSETASESTTSCNVNDKDDDWKAVEVRSASNNTGYVVEIESPSPSTSESYKTKDNDLVDDFACESGYKDDGGNIFMALLPPRDKILDLEEVKNKCRKSAVRFKFELRLFERIPDYIFHHFAAEDPLCNNEKWPTRLEVMAIFAIINGVPAGLMAAFYIECGQSITDSLKLLNFFKAMRTLWLELENNGKWIAFGDSFAFDLETKSLKYSDYGRVDINEGDSMIPIGDKYDKKRNTLVRTILKQGKITVFDQIDVNQVRLYKRNGLKVKGNLAKYYR